MAKWVLPEQGDLFRKGGTTSCGNCNKTLSQDEALVKTYFGREDHFCSEFCYTEEFTKSLRKLEGGLDV